MDGLCWIPYAFAIPMWEFMSLAFIVHLDILAFCAPTRITHKADLTTYKVSLAHSSEPFQILLTNHVLRFSLGISQC